MRTIYLFFSLLLSLTAFGQPSPLNRRAFALIGLAAPGPQIPSLTNFGVNPCFWWVASDVATNVAISNNWPDRIHGELNRNFDNNFPTNAPTNGVHFSAVANQRLTNNNGANLITALSTSAWMVILMPKDLANGQHFLLRSAINGSPSIRFNESQFEATDWSAGNRVKCSWWKDYTKDFVFLATAQSGNFLYTNGILACDQGSTNGFFVNSNALFQAVGYAYEGYIQEIVMWTNVYISPSMISNWHFYSTNFYGTNVIGPQGIYP